MESTEVLEEPPVRVCCGQRHWGAQCQDGLVLCRLCLDLYAPEYLAIDPTDGKKEDVCIPCKEYENVRTANK